MLLDIEAEETLSPKPLKSAFANLEQRVSTELIVEFVKNTYITLLA